MITGNKGFDILYIINVEQWHAYGKVPPDLFQEHGQGRLKFQEGRAAAGAAGKNAVYFGAQNGDVPHDVNTVFLKAFIPFNKGPQHGPYPRSDNAP